MESTQNPSIKTRGELLVTLHNKHLAEVTRCRVDLKLFEQMKDTDVLQVVPVPVPVAGGGQTLRKITVSQQKQATKKRFQDNIVLLGVMEELLAEEGVKVPDNAKAYQIGVENQDIKSQSDK